LAGISLQGSTFEKCSFIDCDLSNVKVNKVDFQNIRFVRCKMLGIAFTNVNPFLLELHAEHSTLDFCNFYNLPLKKSSFQHCRLKEVDFSQAILSEVSFQGSDLLGAVFDRSQLEKADFREAFNFRISPEINSIKGAKFNLSGLPGLLGDYDILID
jgi:uncharacterized protein YjbI with pentapeptide repeats